MNDGKVWSGIHLVCGFAGAGKSEYIRHLLKTSGAFFGATPVYEADFHNGARTTLTKGDVFHLDISSEIQTDNPNYIVNINNHPIALKGVFSKNITSVDFLILPESILHKRLEIRTEFSNDITFSPPVGPYPSEKKLKILESWPLADRYSIWFDYFRAQNVRIRYIHSGNRSYVELADKKTALKILTNGDYSFESLVHEDLAQ